MNPLIERYRQSHRHAMTGTVYAGLYIITLFLTGIWAIPTEAYLPGFAISDWLLEFGKVFYVELWGLQVVMLVWAALQTGRVIPQEVERRSYDFFRLLPLSPHQKASGLIVGVNMPVFYLLALNLILLTLVGAIGQLSLGFHVILQILTFTFGALLIGLSLLNSILPKAGGKRVGGLRQMAPLLPVLPGIPILLYIAERIVGGKGAGDLNEVIPLFALPLPGSVTWLLFMACLAAWSYGGSLHQLHNEDAPLFPRRYGAAFLSNFAVLIFGLVWPASTGEHAWARFGVFVATTLIIGVFVMMGSQVSVGHYLEERQQRQRSLSELWGQLSNLVAHAKLALVLLIWWAAALLVLQVAWAHALILVLVALGCFLFLALLLEVYTLLRSRFGHARLVFGFALAVYMFFPAIATASTGMNLFVLSAADYLVLFVAEPQEYEQHAAIVLLIGALYCGGLGVFVWRQYEQLNAFSSTIEH